MKLDRFVGSVVCAVTVLVICAVPVVANDWAQWRGPNRDGTLSGSGVFEHENIGLKLEWSAKLGPGYSGIAVANGRAVTMFSDGELDQLIALDAKSGDEIWRFSIGETYEGHDGSTDGPLAMPVIEDGIVYALGPHGDLFAVRLADGEKLWNVDTTHEGGAKAPSYGFTTSPTVVGNVVFVETGGAEGRCHTGFDKKTGDVLWTTGDDSVGYQSPILAELAGTEQIVAVSNTMVAGLVPSSGELLWKHQYSEPSGDGAATPVLLGEGRFLLTGGRDSVLLELNKDGDGFEVEEVWRTRALKGNYAVPVLHEGHLYGFDGNFLTCVSAENGEKVWKSRPPGGQGLILVDGHLVILGSDAHVVVARATPEGYEERARLPFGEPGSYTWPSFADGRIFVRDLQAMGSLSVSAAMPAVKRTEVVQPPRNEFERFVREVETAPENKAALIDDFMSAQDSFPIVEGDRWVHFVYRGTVEDIAVTGSMTEFQIEEPLEHVEGTDLHYKSFELEPGSGVEYSFNIDFDNVGPDPANPLRARSQSGDVSVVGLPGWKRPDFLRAYRGDDPGRLDTFSHTSTILENERDVTVYLPPGYDSGNARYPLIVINNGKEWLDYANLTNTLNNLIGSRVKPVIVAFVGINPQGRGEFSGDKTDDYVTMLADEIVPYIDENYRTLATRESRMTMGALRPALISAYVALKRPDVFGNASVHTMYIPEGLGDQVLEMIDEGQGKNVRFNVDWNRYELVRTDADIDLGADSERLWKALESKGVQVAGGESADGYGWGAWSARAGEMLLGFFPM